MKKRNFFGKEVSPFTIPSGIVTTTADTLERIASEIPEVGILTTKSIGLEPRAGNVEPILSQLYKATFTNAVGLANPGAEAFAEELKEIYPLPDGKFLLASIFGATTEEFVKVAKILEQYSDGFELNVSCPHAEKEGYGAVIGTNTELTARITYAVKQITDKPVIVKLTPLANDIGEIAKTALSAGANGISAINTGNPVINIDKYMQRPILTNTRGGVSGKSIKTRGVRCVSAISYVSKSFEREIPIIAIGGIFSAKDIHDYDRAGARFYGIGTALSGMDTEQIKEYFRLLVGDLEMRTNNAEGMAVNSMLINYSPYKIKRIENFGEDFRIFYFDKNIEAEPGQFVFAWLPGIAEKPFSVADDKPLKLAVRKIGNFTSKMFELKEEDEIMVRGPYGKPIESNTSNVYLVAGGCGSAPLYFLAKRLSERGIRPKVFLGARTKERLLFAREFSELSDLLMTTDDRAFVTEILSQSLDGRAKGAFFYNCGPEEMIKRAIEIERCYTSNDRIFSIIERYTKCGIGLCGSCSTADGLRACIDGPIFSANVQTGRKRNAAGGYE